MADNYLEKKMEEHRRQGRCSSYRPKPAPGGNRPGELLMTFTPCELFIDDIDRPGMTGIARELSSAGFKVCFTIEDIHRGSRLAATLGCRFLPASLPPAEDSIRLRVIDGDIEISRNRSLLKISADKLATAPDPTPANASPVILKTVIWGASMLANLNGFHEKVLKNIKIEGFYL